LGISLVTTATSQPATAWIDYATKSAATMQSWLGEDTPQAKHFNTYMQRSFDDGSHQEPVLSISIWISVDGVISRIKFPPFVHPEANQDLQSIIVGRQLNRPPLDMPQPLRLRLRLKPLSQTPVT